MPYREHAPSPALAPFVACFWEVTSDGAPYRVLPDGAMDVLFTLGDSRAQVIGPMTRAIVTDAALQGAPVRTAGVRFRPGAAVELLGLAAREVRDGAALARDVWGPLGRELDARLVEAGDLPSALRAIERGVSVRAAAARAPDTRLNRAVEMLHAAGGELPIPAVSARVGVSERQLERLFDERVGYGPKFYARVARLARSTRAIGACGGSIASWARLAVDCGYTDQAHLVREFRALAGVTPRVYAREAAPRDQEGSSRPGHVGNRQSARAARR